jgi:hypothetical protein
MTSIKDHYSINIRKKLNYDDIIRKLVDLTEGEGRRNDYVQLIG